MTDGNREDYKDRYELEHERRLQLEREVENKESLLSDEHEKLVEIERGLLDEGRALVEIEQQQIKVLKHQLKAENQKRLFAEKERDIIGQALGKCEMKVSGYGSSVGELEREMIELEDTLRKREKLVGELSEQKTKLEKRTATAVKNGGSTDLEDLKELVNRLGSMKVSEAARMLGMPEESVLSHIKNLADGGMIELQHTETGNPTIKATRKLVSEMSAKRMELRKRGRGK